jgi:hypothetical protein
VTTARSKSAALIISVTNHHCTWMPWAVSKAPSTAQDHK